MDEKLERFFNAINFNKDYYKYFVNASVKDVLLAKKTNKMRLVMNIDNLVPIEVFEELCSCGKTLKGADDVRYKFIVKNNNELFDVYFNYYFDILVSKCPMLKSINRNNIKFEDNNIIFHVLNDVEEEKIKSLKEKIETFLIDMGFDDVNVDAVINEEERKKLIDKIEHEDVTPSNKKVLKQIKGGVIVGASSQIKNLTNDQKNVIVIGQVFGSVEEMFTKSGWYIISFNITDFTDSMVCKMFTKDEAEKHDYIDGIKAGKWYKCKGSVSFNERSKDYEYSINSMEEFDKEEIKTCSYYDESNGWIN